MKISIPESIDRGLSTDSQQWSAHRLAGLHRWFLGRSHFGALDGLRCISILAVIWAHGPGQRATLFLLRSGALGVDLFFVISGFLITTLLLRERRSTGSVSLARFYARRSLRIFPLYYAVLAIYTIAVLATNPNPPVASSCQI